MKALLLLSFYFLILCFFPWSTIIWFWGHHTTKTALPVTKASMLNPMNTFPSFSCCYLGSVWYQWPYHLSWNTSFLLHGTLSPPSSATPLCSGHTAHIPILECHRLSSTRAFSFVLTSVWNCFFLLHFAVSKLFSNFSALLLPLLLQVCVSCFSHSVPYNSLHHIVFTEH